MLRVLGLGDNTVDRYLHRQEMFPGGNAVNVAVHAVRAGHAASYLGALGNDQHGKLILNALRQEGVDTSHCRMIEGANAYCEISLQNGDRVFGDSIPGVRSQLNLTEEDWAFIAEHDLVHTGLYSDVEPYLARLAEVSQTLSFDYSSEWDKAYLAKTLGFIDFALLSVDIESTPQYQSLAKWITAQGPRLVLITLGAQGAYLVEADQAYHQASVEGPIVDTLGAGDSFAACFMVECLSGTPPQEALDKAAHAAAQTCQHYGAFGHGAAINH
ncbi:MAG: fructoselysine kinase [Chloroflexi bacterium]|nr:fructoselysine kinase [Chloroflexota bacterium]